MKRFYAILALWTCESGGPAPNTVKLLAGHEQIHTRNRYLAIIPTIEGVHHDSVSRLLVRVIVMGESSKHN